MRIFVSIMLLVSISPPAMAVAPSSRGILEVAPLRGAVGQMAARIEVPLTNQAAVGANYETIETPAEREGARDQAQSFALEGVWYAHRVGQHAWFASVGLKQEDAVAYRETRRDDRTGQSQRADQVYDRWVDRSQYWSATQALGYRWQDGWWTVSVRWTRDELVHANHHAKVEELRSDDPDLSSEGRSVVRQSMSLLAGVALP